MAKTVNLKVREQGAEKAAGKLKKVDSSIQKLGLAAAKAGGIFFAARGMIHGLTTLSDLAGQQELAEKKLATAIGRTSQTLLDYAAALQQQTSYGDEAIIEAQALLGAFTDDENQIKQLTKATLDLAAAKGFDLASAADLVGKSFGSSTNALTRYGIEVKGTVGGTERLKTLTENTAKLFGGQAAAQAETYIGKTQQMKNALGDLGESIGNKINPLLGFMADDLKRVAENMKEVIDGSPKESIDDETLALIKQRDALGTLMTDNEKGFVTVDEMTTAWMNAKDQSDNLTKSYEDQYAALTKQINARMLLINLGEVGSQAEADFGASFAVGTENIKKQTAATKLNAQAEVSAQAAKILANRAALESGLKGIAMAKDAGEASRALANQYIVEGVFGAVKSALTDVPFPANLIAAALAAAAANQLFNAVIPQKKAALGANFETNGPQTILVGDNPGGKEQVQVTPLSSPNVKWTLGGFNY